MRFLKVFLTTFLISCVVLGIGLFSYFKFFNPLDNIIDNGQNSNISDKEIDNDPNLTPLEKAILKSKRINVLIVGLEHVRTDTIMVASYDRENKKADIISVPRDTFYEREGYTNPASKKINAVYQSENIDGLIDAVENLLGIPIHKYVTVDYQAVVKGVDSLGGVEVNVPFKMVYSDPYDTPPLYINIPAGLQLLDGENSLKFLRYRHGYKQGDIGRIKAQQEFVKQTVKKLISFKLPTFIREVYPYVKTNFSISELIALGGDAIGFTMDGLNTNLLPGVGKYIGNVSYYIPNYEEALNLTYKLYGLIDDEPEVENLNNEDDN
ncbi:LCP family protein [Sedimentibacter sp. zth1]|uniref:LCP family protein n=1 Tax=Sedimentibacter sp. zth1 TaxID=2816908 RepID=UPI001A9325EC|nr:LCP family protein [Sedimentibacter sp. zth1]QSX05321.1 LCP family protein [Sedimentibacter sp. zth1]